MAIYGIDLGTTNSLIGLHATGYLSVDGCGRYYAACSFQVRVERIGASGY